MSSSVKIYATGTTGTIGRHLSSTVSKLNLRLEKGDDTNSFSKFESESSLIHLGGIVGAEKVEENISRSYDVNVKGTVKLAESFLSSSSGRFVYVSSSHVYAKSTKRLTEESPTNPFSMYAKQKLETEEKLLKLFETNLERLCIVRVFSVLDWNVAPFTLGGAVKKLIEPNSDFILQNAEDVRDFLTPKRIAEILENITENEDIYGVINLCSGEGIKIFDAVLKMAGSIGAEIPYERIRKGMSQNPYIVGDNARLRKHFPNLDLSWNPSPKIDIV